LPFSSDFISVPAMRVLDEQIEEDLCRVDQCFW